MSLLSAAWFNGLLGIIGVVLGIGGVAIGVWLYFLGKPRPALKYFVSDSIVLAIHDPSYESDLEIRFRGIAVPSVIASSIAVWNDGNTTITSEQIVRSDPFRISLRGESQVLSARVVAESRSVIAPAIDVDRQTNTANISFEFLEAGDGFLIQVLHSGSYGSATLQGTMRGLMGGPKRWVGTRVLSAPWHNMIVSFVASGLLLATLFGIGKSLMFFQGEPLAWWEWVPLLVLGMAAMIVGPFTPDILARRRLSRFPSALRDQSGIAFFLRHLL